jgi:hypothetical protein
MQEPLAYCRCTGLLTTLAQVSAWLIDPLLAAVAQMQPATRVSKEQMPQLLTKTTPLIAALPCAVLCPAMMLQQEAWLVEPQHHQQGS